MRKRNHLLEEFCELNNEIVERIQSVSKEFLSSFYTKREALLKVIDQCDNQISSLSMCNWERFKFEPEYKSDYVELSAEKKKLVTSIIDQDLFIISKVGVGFLEKLV